MSNFFSLKNSKTCENGTVDNGTVTCELTLTENFHGPTKKILYNYTSNDRNLSKKEFFSGP